METILRTVKYAEFVPAGMTQIDRALETEVATKTAAYRLALILVQKALVSNYMEPEDRTVLRKLIHSDTWAEREFDERLCRKYRFDPAIKLETWLRGVEVRFEALQELKNLLELTMISIRSMALSDSRTRAKEEQKQRLQRDASELAAWWGSLTKQERDNGLRGVLLQLDISRKEMDEYWGSADLETKIQLMAMAMHALETKPRELAKDVRAHQDPKPMKRPQGPARKRNRRRGHLRLVTPAAA